MMEEIHVTTDGSERVSPEPEVAPSQSVAASLIERAIEFGEGVEPDDLSHWTDNKWQQWRDHSDGSVW